MPEPPKERTIEVRITQSLSKRFEGSVYSHMRYCSIVSCEFATSVLSVNECSVCLKACHLFPAVPSGLTKDLISSNKSHAA